MADTTKEKIKRAAEKICQAKHAIAFTGAGISLESGVPTFRGEEGSIWSKYDIGDIDINFFCQHTARSWTTIKACFYDFMRDKNIEPNEAHNAIAKMEKWGLIKAVITQNIDALHQRAGSKEVIEFHGTTATATCRSCNTTVDAAQLDMTLEIPRCTRCGGIMKPDFVFFGEGIPERAFSESSKHCRQADICLVVGTTAQVMPAGMVPISISRNGGTIIEINPNKSQLTDSYTDIYIAKGAVEAMTAIEEEVASMMDFDKE